MQPIDRDARRRPNADRGAVARQRAREQHRRQGRQGALRGETLHAADHDEQQARDLEAHARPPYRCEAAAQQQIGHRLAHSAQQRHIGRRGSLGHRGEQRTDDEQHASEHDQAIGLATNRFARVGVRSCQDAAQHELPHRQAASEEARPQVEPPASERCLRRRGRHARGAGRGLLRDRHAYEQLVLTFVRMDIDRRQAAPQDRVHAVG